MAEKPKQPEQKQPVIWRRRVAVVVVFVVAAAIVGRVMLAGEEPTGSAPSGMATGLVPGSSEPAPKEETLGDKLGKLLPYVTDAGIALLLGMIVGIGVRMAIKTVVVVMVVGVIGVQYAIFKGWIAADDASFLGHLKEYVFHIPEDSSASDALLEKAPSAGAGLLGFMMGLKKG